MIYSTVRDEEPRPTFNGFQDPAEAGISPKARTLDYYLYLMEPYFDKFEIYSGEGEIRRPYLYQWWAYSKCFNGEDAEYEGHGGSPLEAARNLYNAIKKGEA